MALEESTAHAFFDFLQNSTNICASLISSENNLAKFEQARELNAF